MRTQLLILLTTFILLSCTNDEHQDLANDEHQDLAHNFTVQRLIIINDRNEMLMCREETVWASPSIVYNKPQFLKEGLDSLANMYGIQITSPKLHGYFSYKYDYQPYSTLRSYFVAKYVSGEIKIPEGLHDAQWVPLDVAIEKNSVTSIKQITKQIIKFPNIVWGGSFLVSHVGDEHPTKMVEQFYPLFQENE